MNVEAPLSTTNTLLPFFSKNRFNKACLHRAHLRPSEIQAACDSNDRESSRKDRSEHRNCCPTGIPLITLLTRSRWREYAADLPFSPSVRQPRAPEDVCPFLDLR